MPHTLRLAMGGWLKQSCGPGIISPHFLISRISILCRDLDRNCFRQTFGSTRYNWPLAFIEGKSATDIDRAGGADLYGSSLLCHGALLRSVDRFLALLQPKLSLSLIWTGRTIADASQPALFC